MANLTPTAPIFAHVADTGRRLSFLFLKSNRKDVRNLTGFAARVFFNYVGQDPHLVRAAQIDAVNGLVLYRLRGDEFTQVGDVEVQPRIVSPDWYGNGSTGTSYEETAGEIVKIRVLVQPS